MRSSRVGSRALSGMATLGDASLVAGGGMGIVGDIVVGVVGAFIGGWVFRSLGSHAPFAGIAGTITVAFVGAVLLVALLRLVRSGRRRPV